MISADGERNSNQEAMQINASETQEFFHYKDFSESITAAGESVEYYFEVWDNDGVNGSKSSRTAKKTYQAPTESELDDARTKSSENIKEQVENRGYLLMKF